jgi:hypothetical protein
VLRDEKGTERAALSDELRTAEIDVERIDVAAKQRVVGDGDNRRRGGVGQLQHQWTVGAVKVIQIGASKVFVEPVARHAHLGVRHASAKATRQQTKRQVGATDKWCK